MSWWDRAFLTIRAINLFEPPSYQYVDLTESNLDCMIHLIMREQAIASPYLSKLIP